MSLLPFSGAHPILAAIIEFPATRGRLWPRCGSTYGLQLLPGDVLYSVTLTFDGVHAGSEIRIYQTDLTEVAGVESCDADHALSVPYYGAGAAGNAVMIRIVSLSYDVIELAYTIPAASASIPIQQRRDRWYSNP